MILVTKINCLVNQKPSVPETLPVFRSWYNPIPHGEWPITESKRYYHAGPQTSRFFKTWISGTISVPSDQSGRSRVGSGAPGGMDNFEISRIQIFKSIYLFC